MKKRIEGSVLVIVVVILLLLIVVGRYVGYAAVSSLREAAMQKEEVELKSSMRITFQQLSQQAIGALINDTPLSIDLIFVDPALGCREFANNEDNIRALFIERQSHVLLLHFATECRDSTGTGQYQLWMFEDGLFLKGNINIKKNVSSQKYLWTDAFGTIYEITLGVYDESEPCGQNCNQLELYLKSKKNEATKVEVDRDKKTGQSSLLNYFLAVKISSEGELLLIDRLGNVWLANIFFGVNLDLYKIAQFDIPLLISEELTLFRSYQDGENWRLLWGFGNHIYVSYFNIHNFEYGNTFTDIVYSGEEKHPNAPYVYQRIDSSSHESWKLLLRGHKFSASDVDDMISLLSSQGDRYWLWLLSWKGSSLLKNENTIAFIADDERLVKLDSCSYSLEELIKFQKWQIGCQLPTVSHIQFVY